jgi:hypothetical protein
VGQATVGCLSSGLFAQFVDDPDSDPAYPKVKVTQEMIDAGREDLEPYLNQELTVIAWLWARTVTDQAVVP